MRYTNHMITETKSSLVELPVRMCGFPNYFEEIKLLRQLCRALPDEARHTDFDLKPSLRKRSSPSLRSGAMASEVALPVQFSNLNWNFDLETSRALPDVARRSGSCLKQS